MVMQMCVTLLVCQCQHLAVYVLHWICKMKESSAAISGHLATPKAESNMGGNV